MWAILGGILALAFPIALVITVAKAVRAPVLVPVVITGLTALLTAVHGGGLIASWFIVIPVAFGVGVLWAVITGIREGFGKAGARVDSKKPRSSNSIGPSKEELAIALEDREFGEVVRATVNAVFAAGVSSIPVIRNEIGYRRDLAHESDPHTLIPAIIRALQSDNPQSEKVRSAAEKALADFHAAPDTFVARYI